MTLPKLIMTRDQFYEITYLVDKCPYEISGMGTLLQDDNGDFILEKLFLLKQTVGSASTDIDAEALTKCLYEARDCKGTMSFWWHSHVNMSAFFSGTDQATIKDHGKNGYFVGLVINKKGDVQIGMAGSKPKFYINSGLSLHITDKINQEIKERLDKEYIEKVSTNINHIGWQGGNWEAQYEKKRNYAYRNDYHGYNEDDFGYYGANGKWYDNKNQEKIDQGKQRGELQQNKQSLLNSSQTSKQKTKKQQEKNFQNFLKQKKICSLKNTSNTLGLIHAITQS